MNESTIRILAVDDDADLCALTKIFLETFDHLHVDMAYSVHEAMTILSGLRYDAIVSDYQMPEEDGILFLKQLRSRSDHTPFILFTGKGREEIVIEAIDSGADAYVQKGGETRSVFSDLAHKIRESVAKVRAENALTESEARYRSLIDGSPVGIFLTDTKYGCIYSNRAWLEMISRSAERSQGREWMSGIHPDDRESYKINWKRSVRCEGEHSFEYRYVAQNNRTIWIWGKVVPLKDTDGTVTGYMSTNVDVTDRKRVESDLLEKERTLAKASNLAKIGYWIWNAEKGIISFSDGLSQILGIEAGTALPHDLFFDMVHPDDRKAVIGALEGTLKGKGDFNIEHRMMRSDGSTITVRDTVEVTTGRGNRPLFMLGVIQDITEHWRLNREFIAIKECNRALVKAKTEQDLLDKICHIICDVAGYRLAWIGMAQVDRARSVRPVAWSGSYEEYVKGVNATWAEDDRGNGPTGKAIRDGTTVSVQDYSSQVWFGPWREAALRAGIRSGIAIPLMDNGIAFGALNVYSNRTNGFSNGEVSMLEEMSDDLAFGILNLRAREHQLKADEALRQKTALFEAQVTASLDGILVIDQDMKRILVNRQIVELYDVPDSIMENEDDNLLLDWVIGLTKYPEQFIEKVNYLNDHVNETSRDEVEFKNGMVLDRYSAPVFGKDGKCYGRTWTFRDITDRKRTEKALREANRKLNLLSSMTRHDLSNKILSLKGNLALLERDQPQLVANEHILNAERAADQLSAMIRFSEEYEDIGIHAPVWKNVRELINTCADEVPLGPVKVVNEVPPSVELLADPLIVKVFQNLMTNTIRHGGKAMTIRFYLEEVGNVRSIVCVDDGVGVPDELREKLFTKGFGNDHGLGLFLSREILSITGITISERGQPGMGARFIISPPPEGLRDAPGAD
jgi:PAS domain S-box-containing protein